MSVLIDDRKKAWLAIQNSFFISVNNLQTTDLSDSEVQSTINAIQKFGIAEIVVNLAINRIWDYLRDVVTPKFWSYFKCYIEEQSQTQQIQSSTNSLMILSTAVTELHDIVLKFIPIINRCEQLCQVTKCTFKGQVSCDCSLLQQLQLHLQSALHSQMPDKCHTLIYGVYEIGFRVYCHKEGHARHDGIDMDDLHNCRGCQFPFDECCCVQISDTFSRINKKLCKLELLERLAGSSISDFLFAAISEHVSFICRDSYDQHRIATLEKWLECIVVGWLEYVYCGTGGALMTADSAIQDMISTNLNHTYRSALYHTYTLTRINQLFNIVIDYPESQPALEDIRECMEKTDLRDTLVKSLRNAIQTRLLHPGVNTVDILHAYISTIKALRVLDSKGVLLELVSEPIRHYLRSRFDFIRYIVTSLTDDSCSELSEELMGAAPSVPEDPLAEMANWETWTPDPVHAQNLKSKAHRTTDIISMLVNIYGCKDVFITEYRTILADRILSQFTFDIERDIRCLEHLKVRFGETLPQLHKCDVMLKDVASSKRINASIHMQQNSNQQHPFPISAMLLSAQFWPSFKEESLQLPQEVIKQMQIYTEAFQDLKGNRTLSWKHHLGKVELEIEIANKVLELTVTPMQAVLIHLFQDKTTWSLEDLSLATLVPKANIRRKITFWQTQGLIQETDPDVYLLVEDASALPCTTTNTGGASGNVLAGAAVQEASAIAGFGCLEEEAESVIASAQDQRQEELQELWSYIVGMLTNLKSLPLERIHSMLKIFVQDSCECSVEELRIFLDNKVKQHLINYVNGSYQLPKT